MNRTAPSLRVSKAVLGFLQYKAAEALSPRTLEAYGDHLKQWQAHCGDVEVRKITAQDLRASEPCALTVDDLDQKAGKLSVKHGAAGAVALSDHA